MRPHWQSNVLRWTVRAALLLMMAGSAPALAQPRPASAPAPGYTLIDASADHFWIAETDAQRALVMHRSAQAGFDVPRLYTSRLARLAALDGNALLFLENGAVVQSTSDAATLGVSPSEPRADMPQRRPPIDAIGIGSDVYALAESPALRGLPRGSPRDVEGAFDPSASAVSVITLSPRGWAGVAPCPTGVIVPDSELLRPRLLAVSGNLAVFWSEPDGTLAWSELDLPTRTWRTGGTMRIEGLSGFVPLVLSRVPTLIVAIRHGGHEDLKSYRLLSGTLGGSSAQWAESELQLSALPEQASDPRITDAVGFNQHVALAVTAAGGERFVRFGRLGEPPVEKTISLKTAFEPPMDEQFRATVQYISLAVMIAVIALLFIFRRGATLRDPTLPAPWQPALHIQRLVGAAIDIIPFSLAASLWLQISWQDAVRAVFDWASPFSGVLPSAMVIAWWGLTAAMYVTYSTVMELAAGRTVGKALTGTRIRSYTGETPAMWQRLVRNVVRLAEVHPPFWLPLAMLFIITRSHQRLGDLFAKTVVVRKGDAVEPPKETPSAAPPGDPPGAGE